MGGGSESALPFAQLGRTWNPPTLSSAVTSERVQLFSVAEMLLRFAMPVLRRHPHQARSKLPFRSSAASAIFPRCASTLGGWTSLARPWALMGFIMTQDQSGLFRTYQSGRRMEARVESSQARGGEERRRQALKPSWNRRSKLPGCSHKNHRSRSL